MVGIFEEGTYNTPGGDLVQLKDYVMARALWDPPDAAAANATIAEFLRGYYGQGAAGVAEYMRLISAGVADDEHVGESFDVDAPFLQPQLLLPAAAALNAAAAAAEQPRFAARAKAASMPAMYVCLFRWDELRKWQAAHPTVPWPYADNKQAQFATFKALYASVGVTRLNEHGNDIDWMHDQLFPGAAPPARDEQGAERSWPGAHLHAPRPDRLV